MKKVNVKQQQYIIKIAISTACLCLSLLKGIQAQVMDSQNKIDVVLDDGTQVIMYGKAVTRSNLFAEQYYYLPTNLRLSSRPDGTKEFLFLKFTSEERGQPQGAIMHFLMEWGLTPQQEREAQIKLRQKVASLRRNPESPYKNIQEPVLVGAADVSVEDGSSFRIISSVLTDKGMANVVTSGKASTLPGAKVAVAAKLDKTAAQLLAATFEKNRSVTDVSLELNFNYNVRFPAVDGQIIIDWQKVQKTIKKDMARYSETTTGKKNKKTYRSYNEVRDVYNEMIENKAVVFEIDKNTTNDEVADKIVEGFMNVFLKALTDVDNDSPPAEPSKKEKEDMPDIKYGRSYTYNRTKAEKHYKRVRQVYNLKYRTAITKPISLTGNMGAWYDGVRDNPKCVASVNLNDPFFQHRDINLILDLDAEEMFGKEVNYVTVNVRKRRSEGNDFKDQVTIDRKYLKEKGIRAALTYARGEDTNSDLYEYKMQWSLRGGKIYPPNPKWTIGDWEGVTLAPPVKPRSIEVEGDLDALKKHGVTRVTAEVRYYKFGIEQKTNIPLTVSKGEPLINETIFTDKYMRGYAYRIIFRHKTEGVLALPWETKINDDYIYASIPEKFNDINFRREMKDLGGKIIKTTKNKILDRFKELIGASK